MNIAAMLRTNGQTTIKRVRISQSIQQELKDYIFSSLEDYINHERVERVEFTGEFKPDNDQVFMIANFELPFDTDFISNTINLETLQINEIESIYGLIFSEQEKNEIIFQTFDSRKILGNKKWYELVYNQNDFVRFNKKGIIIDKRIDGVYLRNEQTLLFRSFHNISRLFDMKDYYREATNEEIEEFGSNELINVDNIEDLHQIADTQIRKYIYLIQKNEILNNLQEKGKFSKAKEFANKFEIGNLFDENEQKITIPVQNKKKTKLLLKFLNEDIYEAPITDSRYETNSKRRIS